MADNAQNSIPTQAPVNQGTFDEVSVIARQAYLGPFNLLLQADDDTLVTRSGGRGLRLYDELERDAKVFEALQKRKLALVSKPWRVEPASNSRIDKKAADLVRSQLEQVGFDQLTSDMLDATLKGISFIEPMWARDGAEIVLTDAIHVEPWYFVFDREPLPSDLVFARHALRILDGQSMAGQTIPPRKMMAHRYGQKYNNPWGLGLGTRLFWPVFFKRNGIQFWLSFAERFGTPVPVGKYPNNATPGEKSTLKKALRAFTQEASIMVPQNMEIALLEAARSGIDTYEKLVVYMDDQISGIVLGKSGGRNGSGGQMAAAAKLENDVRLELVKGDADLNTDTLTRQLVKSMTELNYPTAGTPRVERVIEEPKDLQATAQAHKSIFDMGYRPTLAQVQNTFGGEWIDILAAKLTANASQTDDSANFAAPAQGAPYDQDAIDQLLAAVPTDLTGQAMANMLTPVLAAVRSAKNPTDALAAIADVWPDVPLDELQDILAKLMFAAELWGYATASEEVRAQ